MIRTVKLGDAKDICDIYNYYIENTVVTFDEEPINIEKMEKKIKKIIESYPFIVYEFGGKVVGYAYATEWNDKSAYRYSVESTIYLKENFKGQGIGTKLYGDLLFKLGEIGIHTVIALITQPNPSSIAMHEKLGFKKVGEFNDVGYKNKQWLDVGNWQYHINTDNKK